MQNNVLVVEDADCLLELMGSLLTSLGWNATVSHNAQEALEKLEHELPSIIILDVQMAIRTGFEFARMLKRHPVYREIPILTTSGDPSAGARQQCLSAGCDDFISKPFSMAALHQRLTFLSAATQTKSPIRDRDAIQKM